MRKRGVRLVLSLILISVLLAGIVSASWYDVFVDFWDKITGKPQLSPGGLTNEGALDDHYWYECTDEGVSGEIKVFGRSTDGTSTFTDDDPDYLRYRYSLSCAIDGSTLGVACKQEKYGFISCYGETCGDGYFAPGLNEECDDANRDGGDGCSSLCEIEKCYSGGGGGVSRVPDGTKCITDDNSGGVCLDGKCVPDLTGSCKSNSDCDDNDDCTQNVCENEKCAFPADPGNACTKSDGSEGVCDVDGKCVEKYDECDYTASLGEIKSKCDDGNDCTYDGCNVQGKCFNSFSNNDVGKACFGEIGNDIVSGFCNSNGDCVECDKAEDCEDRGECVNRECNAGLCIYNSESFNTKPCTSDAGKNSECTLDYCYDGVCQHDDLAGHFDGDKCVLSSGLLGSTYGICLSGGCVVPQCLEDKDCNDGNDCTQETCNKQAGGQCVYKNNNDLTKCSLGLLSSGVCSNGKCTKKDDFCEGQDYKAPCPDDGDLCTDDYCSYARGCVHVLKTKSDGNICTLDYCVVENGKPVMKWGDPNGYNNGKSCPIDGTIEKGVCSYGDCVNKDDIACNEDKDCDDGNDCTTGKCFNKKCEYFTVENKGKKCQISSTISGYCDASGNCNLCYEDKHCDDNNECTEDKCSKSNSGAWDCFYTNKPTYTSCGGLFSIKKCVDGKCTEIECTKHEDCDWENKKERCGAGKCVKVECREYVHSDCDKGEYCSNGKCKPIPSSSVSGGTGGGGGGGVSAAGGTDPGIYPPEGPEREEKLKERIDEYRGHPIIYPASRFTTRSFSFYLTKEQDEENNLAYKLGPSGTTFNENVTIILKHNGKLFDENDSILVWRYEDEEAYSIYSVESTDSVSKIIGSEGGFLELDNIKLEIPENALNSEVNISMEKVYLSPRETGEEIISDEVLYYIVLIALILIVGILIILITLSGRGKRK